MLSDAKKTWMHLRMDFASDVGTTCLLIYADMEKVKKFPQAKFPAKSAWFSTCLKQKKSSEIAVNSQSYIMKTFFIDHWTFYICFASNEKTGPKPTKMSAIAARMFYHVC